MFRKISWLTVAGLFFVAQAFLLTGKAQARKKVVYEDEDSSQANGDDSSSEEVKPEKKKVEEEPTEEVKPKKKKTVEEEPTEEVKPKKRRVVEEEPAEEVKSKKKYVEEEPAEEVKPRKRHVEEDSTEEVKPRKRVRYSDDDEEEAAPRRRHHKSDGEGGGIHIRGMLGYGMGFDAQGMEVSSATGKLATPGTCMNAGVEGLFTISKFKAVNENDETVYPSAEIGIGVFPVFVSQKGTTNSAGTDVTFSDNMTLLPIMLSVYANYPISQQTILFGGLGIGYVMGGDYTGKAEASSGSMTTTITYNGGLGARGAMGVEYMFSPTFGFYLGSSIFTTQLTPNKKVIAMSGGGSSTSTTITYVSTVNDPSKEESDQSDWANASQLSAQAGISFRF